MTPNPPSSLAAQLERVRKWAKHLRGPYSAAIALTSASRESLGHDFDAILAHVETLTKELDESHTGCRETAYQLELQVASLTAELAAMKGDKESVGALYHELLYQVGKVTPNESRHESAKRIIRQHEDMYGQGGPVAARGTP
jgi:hypothetical protein